MQTFKYVKAAVLVMTVALFSADGASAHQSGPGMMRGGSSGMMNQGSGMGPGMMGQQGYGMMGPGMMGQGGMGPGMMGQGMGPGMMGYGMGPGMMGQGMGPGMMGYGMGPGMMGYGMGPGMMGNGMGPGMMGAPTGGKLAEEDVRGFLDRQLEMRGLSRLKVGDIDASDERVFKADVVTKEDSLVVRIVVDRRTGYPVAFE